MWVSISSFIVVLLLLLSCLIKKKQKKKREFNTKYLPPLHLMSIRAVILLLQQVILIHGGWMRKVQNAGWFSKGILTHGRKSNNTIMIPKKMNNNNNKKRKTSSSSSFFLMISRTRFILKKKKPTYTQVLTDNNFFVCVSHLFSDKSWFPLLKLFLLYTNVKYSHDAPLFSSSFLL